MIEARVEFSIHMMESATNDQIEEWIRFRLRDTCSMSENNPLVDYEIEAMDVEIRL